MNLSHAPFLDERFRFIVRAVADGFNKPFRLAAAASPELAVWADELVVRDVDDVAVANLHRLAGSPCGVRRCLNTIVLERIKRIKWI